MAQDSFDQKKESIQREISETTSDSPDASPKGTIDELCIPIIKLINSHNDLVTTSSCSGRASVFIEGSKLRKSNIETSQEQIKETEADNNNNQDISDYKIGAKGEGGHWLFVTHNENEVDGWWKDKGIKFSKDVFQAKKVSDFDLSTRYILFKYEPLILHVKCRNFEAAKLLFTTAMECGYRESGIGANNIVAIRTSIRLDVPIGYIDESKEELVSIVSEDYLDLMTIMSLDRFKENSRKLNQLYESIDKNIIKSNPIIKEKQVVESREEKRIRKMKEGMARRDEVRAMKELKKSLEAAKLEGAKLEKSGTKPETETETVTESV
ncbi:transferase activity protein [[Candida] boidinii]|nr:transferase activity protein [[Candida] boidinii]